MTTPLLGNRLITRVGQLVICSVLIHFNARAATSTLNPSADAFVTTGVGGNLSGNNYGGAGALSFASAFAAKGEFQSVIQFDLSGTKATFDNAYGIGNWSLSSVTLQLSAAPPNNSIFNTPAGGTFGISWLRSDSWVEGTGKPTAPTTSGITFSTLQNSFISANDQNLGTFSFAGGTNGSISLTLSVSSGLAADVEAGSPVSLRLFSADNTASGLFYSRTGSGPAPLLSVVAVPEPAAIAFGIMACLLGWALHDRRKQR